MLMTLISRVDIRPDCVEISVRRSRLVELLGSGSIDLMTQRGTPDNEAKDRSDADGKGAATARRP